MFCRPGLNVLLGACQHNQCRVDGTSRDLDKATDGTFYGGALISPTPEGRGALSIFLNTSQNVKQFLIKGKFDLETTVLIGNTEALYPIAYLNSSNNYQNIIIDRQVDSLGLVIFETRGGSFQIFEVACLTTDPLYEMAYVDLGSVRTVGVVRTRHWAGGNALSTELVGSIDNVTWNQLASLDPDAMSEVYTRISSSQQMMRYIGVKHYVKNKNWNKVYVWEISAFDEYGPWGAPPVVSPQSKTFRDILGVNGIWGWQTNKYSDSLGSNEGPKLYNAVASHARNYHNMHWDVRNPSHVPDYKKMAAGGGTEGKNSVTKSVK